MPVSKKKYSLYVIVGLIVLFAAGVIYFIRTRHGAFPQDAFNKKTESPFETISPTSLKDSIPMPVSTQWLSDSTRVFLMGNSRLVPVKNYPVQREMKLDGDVFFEVPGTSVPLTIRTKLLILSVTDNAAFRVQAPAKEEWAEVQVLSGNIIAKKAYASQFSEPDTLQGDQMLMINRTIDLMEKEKFEATDLRAWRARLP